MARCLGPLFLASAFAGSCASVASADPVPIPSRPTFGTCRAGEGAPVLPTRWKSQGLWILAGDSDLVPFELYYDWEKRSQRIAVGPQRSGVLTEYLMVNSVGYIVHFNTSASSNEEGSDGTPRVSCTASNLDGWHMPPPNWMSERQCACKGRYYVIQHRTNATTWRCASVDPAVSNWYWFHSGQHSNGSADGDVLPLRFVLTNPDPMWTPMSPPVAVMHFNNFVELTSTPAETFVVPPACSLDGGPAVMPPAAELQDVHVDKDDTKGCGSLRELPSWPDRFTVTSLQTTTEGLDLIPTEVAYDAVLGRQLTRMHLANNTVWDVILRTGDGPSAGTHNFLRHPNGSITCQDYLPLAPPAQKWMQQDCHCHATIGPRNTDLSPERDTVLLACPVAPGRTFVHWYDRTFREGSQSYFPTVFWENHAPASEGIALAFTDYVDYHVVEADFDPKLFEVPNQCLPTNDFLI